MVLKLKYRHGHNEYEIEQPYDQAKVFVDGVQVGLTMTNPKDKFYMVLHPLSRGYPSQFVEMVVKASDGQLRGTLNSPVPMEEKELDEEDDE